MRMEAEERSSIGQKTRSSLRSTAFFAILLSETHERSPDHVITFTRSQSRCAPGIHAAGAGLCRESAHREPRSPRGSRSGRSTPTRDARLGCRNRSRPRCRRVRGGWLRGRGPRSHPRSAHDCRTDVRGARTHQPALSTGRRRTPPFCRANVRYRRITRDSRYFGFLLRSKHATRRTKSEREEVSIEQTR